MPPTSTLRLVPLVLVLLLCASPDAGAASSRLTMGYLDGTIGGPQGGAVLGEARSAGADAMRVPSGWGGIAPTRPADPTDPRDPAYRWEQTDDAVRATRSAGLGVLLSLTGAPAWAEGPRRPADAAVGAWRPDPAAFERFAEALAAHYDGTTPGVPKVTAFQPWNEPNLDLYLAPQWVRSGRGFRAEGARIYGRLLDAFTRGIKRAQPRATVVSAGTAPFGDQRPGGHRTMPVRFVREMLCLSATLHRVRHCRPVHFDVLAHHPYAVRGPMSPALNTDDASVADTGKLLRPLRAAERLGTAPGPRRHPLWVTEVAWDSSPPDPLGVPGAQQARWLQQALWSLWRQGVAAVFWYQVRDQAPVPSFGSTSQSGTYMVDGRPKPSAAAFRFPFVVTRRAGAGATVWLRAPGRGPVTFEVRRGGAWRAVGRARGRHHRILRRTVRVAGATAVRAVQGTTASLPWALAPR